MSHHTHVTHHSGGLVGDLARTFAHSATSAFAWRGVGALFHHAAGIGLLIAVALFIATTVYLLNHRRKDSSDSATRPHQDQRS